MRAQERRMRWPAFVIALVAVLAPLGVPPAAQKSSDEFGKGAYRWDEPGLVHPKLVKHVEPKYTNEARMRRIEGDVEVEAIVEIDGAIGDVRVTKSLDKKYGLDAAAVRAVKQWRFEPGRKDGFPVRVIITVVLQFRLRSEGPQAPMSERARASEPAGAERASRRPRE